MRKDEEKIKETLQEIAKSYCNGVKLIFCHKGTNRIGNRRFYDVYVLKDEYLYPFNPYLKDMGYKTNKDNNIILEGCGLDVVEYCARTINHYSLKFLNYEIILRYYLI